MSAADDASLAASLLAVDPEGLGGACLRSVVQPSRAQWLGMLRDLLPPALPVRRIPFNISDGRLLGGLDLAATLRANRPIADPGALAATHGGVVVVTMAERLTPHTALCLAGVLDSGEISVQRDGVAIADAARVALVLLDESMADDERVPAALLDRLAFLVDLNSVDPRAPLLPQHEADEIAAARRVLPEVGIDAELTAALCGTGLALGAGSVRVTLLAIRAARALAALELRTQVNAADAALAGRLVFAPRATQVPQAAEPPPPEPPPPEPQPEDPPRDADAAQPPEPAPQSPAGDEQERRDEPEPAVDELVLEAARAAIPAGLLARLRAGGVTRQAPASAGRAGALRKGGARGRPAGVRSGAPRGGARLNLLETLRAAAPWQRLRGRSAEGAAPGRVRILADDFRVTHFKQRSPTLTIFAVDASGSAAIHRLAEAKGAVELLLADCYVRRDQVAVIAFRGRSAELLLPPTRSLVRAKRNLAGLPGGGGTPLAAALDSALQLALAARRRGETPLLVLLSDGRANVTRSGMGGRETAQAEALLAARRLKVAAVAALFVDTSPRPSRIAAELAAAISATYVPLPFVDARSLSAVVGAAAGGAR